MKGINKIIATAAISFVVVAIVVLYYRHDPAESVAAPKCIFRLLTGWDCPGCGSQRALHALLHGDISRAWGYNPYIFFAVPAAVVFISVESLRKRYPRLHTRIINPLSITAVLSVTLAWWILRNL